MATGEAIANPDRATYGDDSKRRASEWSSCGAEDKLSSNHMLKTTGQAIDSQLFTGNSAGLLPRAVVTGARDGPQGRLPLKHVLPNRSVIDSVTDCSIRCNPGAGHLLTEHWRSPAPRRPPNW